MIIQIDKYITPIKNFKTNPKNLTANIQIYMAYLIFLLFQQLLA